jgi:mannose-6-phosphate isomerase-like protein (cupin superfamily)
MNKIVVQSETTESNLNGLPTSTLSTMKLQALAQKMKRSFSWVMGKIKSKVLLNSPQKQIVLTILHKNTEVVSLQSSDSITFQVIEGRLKLESKNRSVFINKGRVLTLNNKEEYTLSNSEETAYLLTMANIN